MLVMSLSYFNVWSYLTMIIWRMTVHVTSRHLYNVDRIQNFWTVLRYLDFR